MSDSLSMVGHIIGFIGMVCVVFAYLSVERGWLTQQNIRFYAINLIGAILLLISLLIHFNLGSFIIEIFWILISINGLRHAQK